MGPAPVSAHKWTSSHTRCETSCAHAPQPDPVALRHWRKPRPPWRASVEDSSARRLVPMLSCARGAASRRRGARSGLAGASMRVHSRSTRSRLRLERGFASMRGRRSIRGRCGVDLRPTSSRFGVDPGSTWAELGRSGPTLADLGSTFGVVSGAIWVNGSMRGRIGVDSGSNRGRFGVRGRCPVGVGRFGVDARVDLDRSGVRGQIGVDDLISKSGRSGVELGSSTHNRSSILGRRRIDPKQVRV